jgi:hypothetical protein
MHAEISRVVLPLTFFGQNTVSEGDHEPPSRAKVKAHRTVLLVRAQINQSSQIWYLQHPLIRLLKDRSGTVLLASPTQSGLVSGAIGTHDHIVVLPSHFYKL